ncbi:MAG: hypothetical protein HQL53_09125 [Magnetococcales bacterium]|nr:hypothetical protein [Magnetococcales bacterium]
MKWFRLYAELVHDPKVGMLSDSEHRTFINLMCLACGCNDAGNTGVTVTTATWSLRRDVSADVAALESAGLVVMNEARNIVIKNWKKRQTSASPSTERVRKHRERKRQSKSNVSVTVQKQKVTIPDENRTEENKDLCRMVFDRWREVHGHPRAKLDQKRRRKIQAAIKLGYTKRDLMDAVEGAKRSRFHQGENDRGTTYDKLELILRDADHIDQFIQLASQGSREEGQLTRRVEL